MNEEIKQDYIKSGSIAKKAIEYSKQIVKPGENIYDICEKIESFIKENGAYIGFPVNISVNEIAAHDTGIKNDTRLITENDVVKIDIGTHVNGYVGDTAHTMHWNHDFDDLVNASKNALDEAKAPRSGRWAVVSSEMENLLLSATAGIVLAEPASKMQQVEGSIGRLYGFNIFSTVLLPSGTNMIAGNNSAFYFKDIFRHEARIVSLDGSEKHVGDSALKQRLASISGAVRPTLIQINKGA